jgi:hypothetical protein
MLDLGYKTKKLLEKCKIGYLNRRTFEQWNKRTFEQWNKRTIEH